MKREKKARDACEADLDVEVAIVGTGFSGLGMAIQLRKSGIESFCLFEKAADVGGTWRENTYPGAACDIPSHLYSFSFAPNAGWSRAYSTQSEILAYLRGLADEHGIRPRVRFGAAVTRATFDDVTSTWSITAGDGAITRARFLVLGNGLLHVPALPDIPGRDAYRGASFHSARWDHVSDLRGKRVAVIGTGASAAQLVPEVAKVARKLEVFQRTPSWILPRDDRAFSGVERAIFARLPGAQRAYRAALYCVH
jgi:cation diffusion facilitator CzcD-associated flavoprotein CzcO